MLSGSSELLWLQTNSAGVEPYLQPGVLGETTLLTNATGAYGLAIAEHLLGMLLEIFKKLELYRDAQKQGAWQSLGQVRAVYGATVLVLGMGDIGGEFGRRCKALGAKVIGVRRSPRPCPVGQLRRRLEVARHEAEKSFSQPDRGRFVRNGWLHPRKHGLPPASRRAGNRAGHLRQPLPELADAGD